MRTDNKGRDIFYGIVAIATLIVAIIGATLAYFSVTASSNEGAVNATGAIVSIEYNDGQQVTAQADKLIPATLDVVKQVYDETIAILGTNGPDTDEELTNLCTDHNDRQVCSSYRFTVRSDIERTITAVLNNEHNSFTYLSYAVYDVTNGQWLTLDDNEDIALTYCNNENEDPEDDCFTMQGQKKTYKSPDAINSIFGYTLDSGVSTNTTKNIASDTQIYDLVLFIKETNENQNVDQGKNFRGTIVVEVLDGGIGGNGQISGCVGDDCLD